MRPVITEKFEIEYGDESNLLALSDSWDNQNSAARIKLIYYLMEYFYKISKFSIKTLVEEFKPRVTEKNEVDFRYK